MTRPGSLILVPTPLDLGSEPGSDLREVLAQGVLAQAARLRYWVAENAKTTRAFLKRVDALTPLAGPLQGIEIVELPRSPKGGASAPSPDWNALLRPAREGHDIGLASEAGLPAVADPGSALVAAAHATGIAVLPLAGPSSLLLALAASGLNGQSFAFVGYLPTEAAARAARLHELTQRSRRERQTQIAIETPYRNAALMTALIEHLPADAQLAVACGLTLPGGWCRMQRVAQWRSEPAVMFERNAPAVFLWLAG